MQHNYEHYTAADFVSDDAFLTYHLSPNEQSTQFWTQWVQLHPHRQHDWHEARQLLEAVRLGLSDYARTFLSEEAEASLLARIQATNALLDEASPAIPFWHTTRFSRATIGWAAAACVTVGIGFSIWLVTNPINQPSVYQQQVASLPQKALEQINQTPREKSIRLPDGSSALLFPQSRLSYPADFGEKNRTVYLLGKASFDVVKNPVIPFYVYASELVTRVLGTQFTVEAFEQGKDVVVSVQHGQVNVYPNRLRTAETNGNQVSKGVLILPNQQVVFSRQSEHFSKKIVDEPVALESNPAMVSFEFDEAPVAQAFERIKKIYGINVIYTPEDLKGCQLTASLTEESLFQKLDVITQSIGATYQVVDGEVVIMAKGCNSLQ